MLQAYFAGQTVDAKAIGKKLLGRDIEEHAAKKAFYVTKQWNMVGRQEESAMQRMKVDEMATRQELQREPEAYTSGGSSSKRDWGNLFGSDEDGI